MPTCGNYGKWDEPRLLPVLARAADCNRRACAAV